MLNITCGDIAAGKLSRAGIAGAVLPWRDVLHEGPVPSDVTDRELRKIRACFISSCGWCAYEDGLTFFEERDGLLARAAGEGVALWFEADLYDQLQLLEVVSKLFRLGVPPESVRMFVGARFAEREGGGPQSALKPLDSESMQAANEVWQAFRSPDPSRLAWCAAKTFAGMPYLAGAVDRLLEEYPAMGDGLSRSERVILTVVSSGALSGAEVFKVISAQEEHPFLGDWSCWLVMSRLMAGPEPLLAGGEGIFPDRVVRLTEAGERTLSGESDWMRTGGQGRWIGGVRLDRAQDWRYVPNVATLARVDGHGAVQ